jgi:anti-sigma regulatory factor (Ser/Thr protein kinase)
MLSVALSSLARIRDAVRRQARRCGLPDRLIKDAILVVNELATNVIRHGGGVGALWLWCDNGRMFCQVSDQGPGMDASRVGRPPTDPMGLSGRGLWLVRLLCAEVHISSSTAGTTVTVALTA